MTNADFSSSVSVPIKLMSEGGREQIKDAYENFRKNLGNIMTDLKNVGKKKEVILAERIKEEARARSERIKRLQENLESIIDYEPFSVLLKNASTETALACNDCGSMIRNLLSGNKDDYGLDTIYKDKEGNTLLETNDGSDDIVIVSDNRIEDFKYYGESYKNDGMKHVYDSKVWNDHFKSEFFKFESPSQMNGILGQLNSQWSRQNAIDYRQNPTLNNGVKFTFSETLSQWTNPYLVIGGLSAAVGGLSALNPIKRIGAAKGVRTNPFKGKTFSQVDKTFKVKNFTNKGPNPLKGKGSYFNPKTGTRYYFDKGGMYKKVLRNLTLIFGIMDILRLRK